MYNYYELFSLDNKCKPIDVINSYKNIINKYYNIKKFSQEEINNIKNLKKGLYILLNAELRLKYDKLINKKKPCNILSSNDEIDINLDVLFTSNHNVPENNKYDNITKKIKQQNVESINNRIFQEIHTNNSNNFETRYITPKQCRKTNNDFNESYSKQMN